MERSRDLSQHCYLRPTNISIEMKYTKYKKKNKTDFEENCMKLKSCFPKSWPWFSYVVPGKDVSTIKHTFNVFF